MTHCENLFNVWTILIAFVALLEFTVNLEEDPPMVALPIPKVYPETLLAFRKTLKVYIVCKPPELFSIGLI